MAADTEIPPPPSPLPNAVAQVAAGLLLAPERAGRAGLPTVAGYEILGPLGRGGMGLVYRARQVRLGRVVALKMIRGGAHAEPRDLARFRTEAEAVARLQHPHIVSIFEVGEVDGWAYFALELLAGGSLARQLAGRPQPAGPSAQLVETLARAMAYAHAQGIVHRDLKPANVLLAADGTPKISDFGLAKRLDPEPSSHHDRTPTGEVVGTPSYMAPEQTWGRSGAVGPAADVYALGAILYECLTGRPPFQAATPLDTLQQVRSDDPVPPRRLVPSVPRDLDTVCRKCLQKEPSRRYPSADALADDLQRFLAGEPVRARPAAAWERTTRWARRRPALAAFVGTSAAAVISLATFGVWHVVQLQGYNAELRAERNNAERLRELAQTKEAEALKQKDKAEAQWERAEANFKSALAAVVQLLARVKDDSLAHEPRMELLRRRLVEDALQFCQDFLKQKGDAPAVRHETAIIYRHMGDIQKQLGVHAAAEEAYGAAVRLFEGLADEFPQRPAYRHELVACYSNLGSLLADTPRRKEAEDLFRRALTSQQALADESPGSPGYRSDLAGGYYNLGTLLIKSGRPGEGENALRRALYHWRCLTEEHPQDASYRQDVGRVQSTLAALLYLTDRPQEAEPTFRKALALQQELVNEFPRVPAYRQELAGSHNGMAGVLFETDRLPEAEAEFRRAMALQQSLTEDFPRVPSYRQELAASHCNLGRVLAKMGRHREAERVFHEALEIQQQLVNEFHDVPDQQSALGSMFAHLAELLLNKGRLTDARRDAEQAVSHQRAALRLLPGQPEFGDRLRRAYGVLTETLLRLGDHAAAAETAAELSRHFPADEPVHRSVARLLARCVPLAARDQALSHEKREVLSRAYGDQAMTLLRKGLLHPARPSPEELKSDPHLAPLYPRADFQQLVRELEEAARSGAK
jgi:serine/threonine-protein kinase